MIGLRVRLRIEDEDTDNEGERRVMPVGTWGTVHGVNHTTPEGVVYYDVVWDNDGWTVWSAEELRRDTDIHHHQQDAASAAEKGHRP